MFRLTKEEKLRGEGQEGIHEEILYLDGYKIVQIDKIFNKYGELLLNDGMSKFAVASHVTQDEIFIEKYKVTYIYSKKLEKYIEMMKRYKIKETKKLVTAWNTFSREHPGRCSRIEINGIDIYDVAEELKKQGMYRAKIIES